jgi:MoaA/NifB/PqqE/SkfB family radical SAM enzyme
VVWDITYACPLRCTHCYSESGRRPSRQLSRDELFRVIDAILGLKPRAIVFSGGEPLVVPEIFELAGRVSRAGVRAHLYTSGWNVKPAMVPVLLDVASNITVSVDGATAVMHDRIRGRAGSFTRAMQALTAIADAVASRRRARQHTPALGIDFVVTRSNFAQLGDFCASVAPQFAALDYVFFGAVLPIGLASRPDFAAAELLTEDQAHLLRGGDQFAERLQRLAPASVEICTSDNAMFQMHPDRLAAGEIPAMQVEPDGLVRAMPVYEGTVGSLLEEDPVVLWNRAVQRWDDPFVAKLLRSASTMQAWADATRRIDLHFGSAEDRARIRRRQAYAGAPANQAVPEVVAADDVAR